MNAMPGDCIVCFTDTTICDGPKSQHDITLWTDGHVAYARVSGADDATLISRDLTQISVGCTQLVGRPGEPCEGRAVFDLTDECWTTDLRAVGMLNSYGERIES